MWPFYFCRENSYFVKYFVLLYFPMAVNIYIFFFMISRKWTEDVRGAMLSRAFWLFAFFKPFDLSLLEEISWWFYTHLCKHKWETVLGKHCTCLYSLNKHQAFYHFPEILHSVTHFNILTAIIIMPLVSTSGNKKRRWYLQNGTPPWESVTLKRIQGLLWIKCLPLSTECSRKTKNCYCISCLRGKESLSEGEDAFWRQPVESHGFVKAGKDYWDHHVQVSAQDHHAH